MKFYNLFLAALAVTSAGCYKNIDIQIPSAGTVRYTNNTAWTCRIFLDGGQKTMLEAGQEYNVTNVTEGEHDLKAVAMFSGSSTPTEYSATVSVKSGNDAHWVFP